MNQNELNEILEKHKKWLNVEEGGERVCLSYVDLYRADLIGADLSGANLIGADLSYANLSGANLIGANLRYTDLSYANLSGANLIGADLSYADLSNANLRYTDLSNANLRYTDLSYADLSYANLSGANLRGAALRYANLRCANLNHANLIGADLCKTTANECTTGYWLVCPGKGAFIGYKKADGYIVELQITENAKRSSATTRKCRCSEAKVLSITNLDGTASSITSVQSNYDEDFIYEVGKTVKVEDFDDDRWNECSRGIHFFITREEAVIY